MNLNIRECDQVLVKSLEVEKSFKSAIKTRNEEIISVDHVDLFPNGANFAHMGLKNYFLVSYSQTNSLVSFKHPNQNFKMNFT